MFGAEMQNYMIDWLNVASFNRKSPMLNLTTAGQLTPIQQLVPFPWWGNPGAYTKAHLSG